MKKTLTIVLLVLIFACCKKENQTVQPIASIVVKRITSTSFEIDEQFQYTNGLLRKYTLDLFGSGGVDLNIAYDNMNRPNTVKLDNQDFAQFYYSGNTVTVYIDDRIADSLVYTMDGAGKISHVVKYDDFHGTMLKNGSKTYNYTGNNLTKLEGIDYNIDGTVKFRYTETATYDRGKNALESFDENSVLMEFIFQFFPTRVFTVNSQNNFTSLISDHTSDGYFMTQQINYNADGYPSAISNTLEQFGISDSDVQHYEYH